jgi:ABC-type glycerol-3-phosphate transport system permease component
LVLDNFVSMEATQYGLMMAACCLATVPVFIVFLCGQKFFIKGLTVGAVKG